ncbi:MAG: NifB/NifX family molybdenum-iron cluster-binding protein [Clostridia bacterium]
MKIAIPVNEKNENTAVCPSFGRTYFFMIHDTENGQTSFYDNAANTTAGGAGIKASQSLVNQGVDTVITPRMGNNALDVLNAANIKLLKTIEGTAMQNIKALIAGELVSL